MACHSCGLRIDHDRGTARGEWGPTIMVCAIALFIASGLFGGDWMMAGSMAAINMTEGLAGAGS